MKCPYCKGEHPDDFKFCPITGDKIEELKACTNKDCPDYGKHILPIEAKFCPRCGQSINSKKSQSNTDAGTLFSGLTIQELNRFFNLK